LSEEGREGGSSLANKASQDSPYWQHIIKLQDKNDRQQSPLELAPLTHHAGPSKDVSIMAATHDDSRHLIVYKLLGSAEGAKKKEHLQKNDLIVRFLMFDCELPGVPLDGAGIIRLSDSKTRIKIVDSSQVSNIIISTQEILKFSCVEMILQILLQADVADVTSFEFSLSCV